MNEVIEKTALDERQVEEARQWMRAMIENDLLPIMTIARLAGIRAATISKFYHKHKMPTNLRERATKQILVVKVMFDRVTDFRLNHPTEL